MMTCLRNHPQSADLLIGYLEGTLAAAERAELDGHATACAECRGLLAVQSMLDEDNFATPEVSRDFDARLYARIAADAEQVWWRRWMAAFSFKPVFAGTAVLAMSLGVVALVQGPWSSPGSQAVTVGGPASSQVGVSAPQDLKQASVDLEIEQLERDLEDVELLVPLSVASKKSI